MYDHLQTLYAYFVRNTKYYIVGDELIELGEGYNNFFKDINLKGKLYKKELLNYLNTTDHPYMDNGDILTIYMLKFNYVVCFSSQYVFVSEGLNHLVVSRYINSQTFIKMLITGKKPPF